MAVQQIESGQQVRFRPRRLTHANMRFSDADKTLEFYNMVCGLELVWTKPGTNTSFVTNGSTHHDMAVGQISDLGEAPPPYHRAAPRLNHIAFEMENEAELVEGWRRAQQAGLKFRETDHGPTRSIYISDPEDNGIEIYADVTMDWRYYVNMEHPDRIHSSPWMPGETPPSTEPRYVSDPEIRRVEGAIFHPRRIGHASLAVGDFDGMLDFYTRVVGLDEVLRGPNDSYSVLNGTAQGHALTLFKASEDQPLGLHHVAFEIDEDRELDEAQERMSEAGITPTIQLNHATKRAIFLKDPDGMDVEFFVDKGGPVSALAGLEPALAVRLA